MCFSHPGSDVATLYIFDKQLHYGRWRVSLRVASGVNLHPLPPTQPSISAEAAQHHCPALCGDSRHLAPLLAPFGVTVAVNCDLAVTGLAPVPPRLHMLKT